MTHTPRRTDSPWLTKVILGLVLSLACVPGVSAQYRAQTLPPPFDVPADAETVAFAVNNHGQVFGETFKFPLEDVPVLWTDGVPTRLPVPSGYYFAPRLDSSSLLN